MLKHYRWRCLTSTCTAALVREETVEYLDGVFHGKVRRHQEELEAVRKAVRY